MDRLVLETLAGPMAAALVSRPLRAARAASERSYQALTEMPGAFVHLEVLQGEGGRSPDARNCRPIRLSNPSPACRSAAASAPVPRPAYRIQPRPWFEMCVRVAAAAGNRSGWSLNSDLLHRHLLFIAYCPHPGHRALIIEDVTATHTTRQELQRRDAIGK